MKSAVKNSRTTSIQSIRLWIQPFDLEISPSTRMRGVNELAWANTPKNALLYGYL